SDEHYYTASFYDNGGGIDKKLSQRIFEPYFTTKHDSMGVGMGLYVAKMLVEGGMGGTLSFDGVDGGVQFIIKFKKDDKNQKGIADV
ncbi:MAG TPA: sensor histidine kinase, partial [Campylobacterales bacterium]|nr:sensor histidine kinase [Campylobacterales bacterium]